MIAAPRHRWAVSFADLCLLLLGFMLILQARGADRAAVAGSLRDAFGGKPLPGGKDLAAADLFAPGEAVLRPAARRRLQAIGRTGRALRIESHGADRRGDRLDRWELAAARTAAVARAVAEGGLPADRIGVSIPEMGGGAQRFTLVPASGLATHRADPR